MSQHGLSEQKAVTPALCSGQRQTQQEHVETGSGRVNQTTTAHVDDFEQHAS